MIDGVSVGGNNIEIVIESQLVNTEAIDVQLKGQDRSDLDMLVSGQSQLVDSSIVGEDIDESHVDLHISDAQPVHLKEGVIDHVQKLRLHWVIHEEDLSISPVLLFLTDSISHQKSEEIGYASEGILQDLDPPVSECMKINKGVTEMTALNHLFSGEIHIEKLVECHNSHVEDGAIHHHKSIVAVENLIDIVTVQIGYVFNLNVFLNGDTSGLIVDSKSDPTVVSIADQSNKPIVASNLDILEVVRGAELFLSDVVFLGDTDVRTARAVEHEVVA